MIKVSKKGNRVWVTFIQDKPAVVKGSWNDWKEEELKPRKVGYYSITKVLKPGEYEFGYLVDGKWVVEEDLPKVGTVFGSQNSLLKL